MTNGCQMAARRLINRIPETIASAAYQFAARLNRQFRTLEKTFEAHGLIP
jgi:hypothetical protein